MLGVHFTKPKRMAEAGILSAKAIASHDSCEFLVYSARECDDNFKDYEKKRAGAGRPRTAVDSRPETLNRLADKDKPRIAFGDAVGVVEAAKILGVFWTRIPRLVHEGKIVGRILWSKRGGRSRLWILSRESCERHASEVRRQEDSGTKKGRPRLAR